MPQLRIAPAAVADIESILTWTHETFGAKARRRYERLLIRSISDVASQPDRPGSCIRPEIAATARSYHLFHSRQRVSSGAGRVRHPRHFILYRIEPDGTVEIGRVLHDSMDLARHLPVEYRPDAGDG
jgi:toxin ParE1/3/4